MLKVWIAIFLCWHGVAMATISVQINPPAVRLGETFRLTFTLNEPKIVGVPDFTPLQQDFTIIGTERSTAYSLVNGQTNAIYQWTLLLSPIKTGMIFIPSIQFGHQESTATSVEVTASDAATADETNALPQDEVMIKTAVDVRDPFINQQIIYTVKLYNNQRLLDAEYLPPQVEDALMVPMGDGRRYRTTLDGRGYTVEEQQYAIFPQKSGELKIIPPTFNALVYAAVPKRISVHAKTTQLKIKPTPTDYKGKYWLPAKQMAITEVYDRRDSTLSQGSALVRTVTIQAAGMPAQLLPTLTFASTSEFNAYPEKPELHNTASQQQLVGRADIKVSYVLNKAGHITIPAIEVPWFNTDTGKEEITSLPERTIEIVGSTSAATPPANKKIPLLPPTEQPVNVLTEKSGHVAWWLAGVFALAWLVTLALWWFRKRQSVTTGGKREALKALQATCKKNTPRQARTVLLQWARLQWPDVALLNLDDVANRVQDRALKKQLSLLSQALYSQERTIKWQGDALWQSVRAYLQARPVAKRKGSELPPINP